MAKPSIDFFRLNQKQIAAAHGVSDRQVRTWREWGLPRNDDGTYCLVATVLWRIRNSDYDGIVRA
jgi:hypothetical protein